LPPGQAHEQVGAQPPVVEPRLLHEVAVLEHAGQLAHAAELHLAPAAARLRRAQRVDERLGAPGELALPLA
jgi:hypothetical protein